MNVLKNRVCWATLLLAVTLPLLSGCGEKEMVSEEDLLEAPERLVEADLGSYFITIRIDEAQRAYLRVQLVGLINEDYMPDFTELHEQRKERMRERIENLLQTAEIDHLKQPGIPIIKTEITTAVKKILRTPHLVDIVCSEYSLRQG